MRSRRVLSACLHICRRLICSVGAAEIEADRLIGDFHLKISASAFETDAGLKSYQKRWKYLSLVFFFLKDVALEKMAFHCGKNPKRHSCFQHIFGSGVMLKSVQGGNRREPLLTKHKDTHRGRDQGYVNLMRALWDWWMTTHTLFLSLL